MLVPYILAGRQQMTAWLHIVRMVPQRCLQKPSRRLGTEPETLICDPGDWQPPYFGP